MIKASNEIIALKDSLQSLQHKYVRNHEFKTSTNAIGEILNNGKYVESAIRDALENISEISHSGTHFTDEWDPVTSNLVQLDFAHRYRALQFFITQVSSETFTRNFISKSVILFRSLLAKGIGRKPWIDEDYANSLMSELSISCQSYLSWKRDQMSNSRVTPTLSSAMLITFQSAVILLFLGRCFSFYGDS